MKLKVLAMILHLRLRYSNLIFPNRQGPSLTAAHHNNLSVRSVSFSDPLGAIFSVCFREIRFYISSGRSHLDQQVTLAYEIPILDP